MLKMVRGASSESHALIISRPTSSCVQSMFQLIIYCIGSRRTILWARNLILRLERRTKDDLQCYIRDPLSALLFFACSKDNFWTIDYFCIRVVTRLSTPQKHLHSTLRKVSKGVISQATADQMSDPFEMSIEKSISGCSCQKNSNFMLISVFRDMHSMSGQIVLPRLLATKSALPMATAALMQHLYAVAQLPIDRRIDRQHFSIVWKIK